MTNSVTIKDVAQRAEVSIGTVSRVLNKHSNVNEEIRQRVLKAAAELGYYGAAGQGTQGNERALKEIGFFLSLDPATDTRESIAPFWANILHGAEMEARKANIKVAYRNITSISHTSYLLPQLYDMRLGGVLLVGPTEPDTISMIGSTKLPLVLVDNYVRLPGVDAVLSDNYGGTMQVMEYLLQEGHRRIGFISGLTLPGPYPVNKLYTIEWRCAGYRTALQRAGLPVDDALVESCDLSPEGGYEACKRLMDRTQCSAIFCANDPSAIGVLRALRDLGLRVPEDVSVVGFDDDMAEHLIPALTTVRVNKEAMGATAVKCLLARASDPLAVSVTSILDVELIKRYSVAAHLV